MIEKFYKSLQKNSYFKSLSTNPDFIKYQVFIIPSIVLVLSFMLVILITIPQFLKLLDTNKTIDELKNKQGFLETKNQTLEQIDKDTYKTSLDTALIALPVDRDIPGLVGQVLVAVGSSGLKLNGVAFSQGITEDKSGGDFSIKLDLTGTISQLDAFILKIKDTPRIIKVTAIELNTSSATSTLNAVVTLLTYSKGLPNALGSVDQPVAVISQDDKNFLDDISSKVSQTPQQQSTSSASSSKGKKDPFN